MSRAYRVILTPDASEDLTEILEYVATRDAPAKAGHVLDQIAKVLDSLEAFPERGAYTKELLAMGSREYRETYFKPYRLIYGIDQRVVNVYLIVDGRRDIKTLLEKRLLRP